MVGCLTIQLITITAYLATKSKDLIEEHVVGVRVDVGNTDVVTVEVTGSTGGVDVLDTGQVSRQVLGAGLESTDQCM